MVSGFPAVPEQHRTLASSSPDISPWETCGDGFRGTCTAWVSRTMTTERLGHLTGRTSSRPSGQESSGPVGRASRQAKAMGRLSTSSRSVHQRASPSLPPVRQIAVQRNRGQLTANSTGRSARPFMAYARRCSRFCSWRCCASSGRSISRTRDPAAFGRLLGLDRAPEVKTLRRRLTRLAAHHCAEQLGAELARVRVDQRGQLMGFLYVDGHVRAYHGQRAIASNAYVARRHLAMPASTDYWINDRSGEPLLVVTGE